MGLLTDYFHAPDAETVVRAMEQGGGGPVVGEGAVFDGFELKGVEPVVGFGGLVAVALGVEWDPDLAGEAVVWPAEGLDADGESWVYELGARARDAVAGVPDSAVAEVAARWAATEEWEGTSAEDLREVVAGLVAVAREARDGGGRLYCWCSL